MNIINPESLEQLMLAAKTQMDFKKIVNESPDKAIECATTVLIGERALEYALQNHFFVIFDYILPYVSYEEYASIMKCCSEVVTTLATIFDGRGIKTIDDCQKLYEKIIKEGGNDKNGCV